ncbi:MULTISPECIES: NHLP-related RiPP peptide [Xanthomonas]|uniref:NHLP-related RiPP peptide n=1 Tax=Xanthomonas TaxID=338 RepID=UPI0012FF0967|nr:MULTISPECIES: NHLP-related RiPP peptide [Xanthomonas]
MNLAVQLQKSKDARASASKITDAQATQLLTLLVEDDAFRANFEADPIAALSLIGIYPEDVKSGDCMTTEKLASKEELNASRVHLYNYLTSRTAFQNPHYFESGKLSKKFVNKNN